VVGRLDCWWAEGEWDRKLAGRMVGLLGQI
jgi:hypothetical protein